MSNPLEKRVRLIEAQFAPSNDPTEPRYRMDRIIYQAAQEMLKVYESQQGKVDFGRAIASIDKLLEAQLAAQNSIHLAEMQ